MRTYADSSFILRLITGEADSPHAISEYRRLGKPRIFYLPLHAVEIRTAIFQRAFHERRSFPSGDRAAVTRRRDTALGHLDLLLKRRALIAVEIDLAAAFSGAILIANSHAERLGARSIDILHVSCARALETESFITCDHRQVEIAQREGLNAHLVCAA